MTRLHERLLILSLVTGLVAFMTTVAKARCSSECVALLPAAIISLWGVQLGVIK